MKLPVAKENEVYASRELIDFGSGLESLVVIYPKNKIIPKWLADEATRKLKDKEGRENEKLRLLWEAS